MLYNKKLRLYFDYQMHDFMNIIANISIRRLECFVRLVNYPKID